MNISEFKSKYPNLIMVEGSPIRNSYFEPGFPVRKDFPIIAFVNDCVCYNLTSDEFGFPVYVNPYGFKFALHDLTRITGYIVFIESDLTGSNQYLEIRTKLLT